jgi:DNA polymerase III epsilon subunit family exonuclease
MDLWAARTVRDSRLAVIDTETTGVSASFGHRIIEIGVVLIESGRVVGEYEQLIDPQRHVSLAITALTGITNEMVVTQPRFSEVMPKIQTFLEGSILVGHNVSFDLSFLDVEFRRETMDLVRIMEGRPVLDTVRLARKRFGRGGNSLGSLARRLGIQQSCAHRALDDARTTFALLRELLDPVGGFDLSVKEAMRLQGGTVTYTRSAQVHLPIELQEALDESRPVMMEYLDADGRTTRRVINPLQIRRSQGELSMVAHCHLRGDRRTFKLDRIVRLTRLDPNAQVDPAELIISTPESPG